MSEYLDKFRKKAENKPVGPSAADPASIERHLPSKEEEYKRAEELTELFDNTKRAGAGGIKSGSVGIRPSGGVKASKFLEDFTGTGRHKPKPELFSEAVDLKSNLPQRELKPPAVILPPNFCPDCNEFDIVHDKLTNFNITPVFVYEQLMPGFAGSMNLDHDDVIICLFCIPCSKKAYAASQVDSRTEIAKPVISPTGEITHETPSQTYLQVRLDRIPHNVLEYMKAEKLKGDSPIFVKEKRKNA